MSAPKAIRWQPISHEQKTKETQQELHAASSPRTRSRFLGLRSALEPRLLSRSSLRQA
jgi:hypothetical protein